MIAAGLPSIVVWSWWARRHFGDHASLLCAGLLALSTFHVRYSQELRAYAYLILLSGIIMLAGRFRLSRGANDWGLELLGRRWQFLTVAAAEGEASTGSARRSR